MKIYDQGDINLDKQTIYIDIDDVILKSSDMILKMIYNLYGDTKKVRTNPEMLSWNFKSVYRDLTQEKLNEFFESDYFWENVELNQKILKVIEQLKEDYNWIFVTIGTDKNLEKKYQYLKQHELGKNEGFGFYGVNEKESKKTVKMFEGIQIDDNYNLLKDTDARVKILYKDGNNTNYNNYFNIKDNLNKLYVVDDEISLLNLLKFNINIKL